MCKCSEGVTRRDAMRAVAGAAAAMAAAGFPLGWASARAAEAPAGAAAVGSGRTKKVLFFTKSAGFQHSCITRPDNQSDAQLSHAENVLVQLGRSHGFEVTATKDGSVFTPEKLAEYDVIAFYTTGDLTQRGTDGTPGMPEGGKEALLQAINNGKGFVGFHCATDTFGKHVGGGENENAEAYIKMVGGEFDGHGAQQDSRIRLASRNFPGSKDVGDFNLHEEWYLFKNLAPDMHVILVHETQTMSEDMYKRRKDYPETWARVQGKGRVFYTSMGHREDVWTNELFHKIVLGGLSWAAGNVEAEIPPNLREACPEAEKVRPAEA